MSEDDAVSRYVQAKQQGDVESALACFAPDAVVRDDGREHVGIDAVRTWMEEVSSTFDLTYEVVAVGRDGTSTVAQVAVAGNFPGSPITFHYDAEVVEGRIRALAIAPA
jgi:ketosteroid isomerase-like protein